MNTETTALENGATKNTAGTKMTFLGLAEVILKEAKIPLSFRQIWDLAVKKGLDKKLGSLSKTPHQTLCAGLYVDIRDNKDSKFIFASKKPTTFWLKKRKEELKSDKIFEEKEKIELKENSKKEKDDERDLHPLLATFLKQSEYFNAYSKTIYHERSSKMRKGRGEWIHPDMIAVHFPFDDYDSSETFELAKKLGRNDYKIYSFELKISLGFSNLKESYFQAVSNSSWANEGYLVAFEIDDSNEFLNEVEKLNRSFGIGLIHLNESRGSEIKFLSAKRELDFQTLNDLCEVNTDFKEFIKELNKDINTNDKERINKKKYDPILNEQEIKDYIIKHKIKK